MIDDNFIKNLYQYTRKRINFLFPGIDINYMDISHSVIADERFSIENWRDLVDRLIYDEVSFIKRNNRFGEADLAIRNTPENILLCNKCGEYVPESKFYLSTKICNSCYYIENREKETNYLPVGKNCEMPILSIIENWRGLVTSVDIRLIRKRY